MSVAAAQWDNPDILPARETALAVLRPTEAELEHGLELHAHATVVDTYGFSAMAAPDPQRIQWGIDQNLDPAALKRLRIESMMTRMADDPRQRALFAEAWRASGVTCVIRNSGEEGNRIERLIERLAHNTYVVDQLPELMLRATSPREIAQAKSTGRHSFVFTTNGVPLPGHDQSVAEELSGIRLFFQLGVRMMHLTYNRRNRIGDGCAEPRDGGLSDFGRAVVAEMNRTGIIADVAHSSQQTALDAAACSERPIVASHTTCSALNAHCRAKSDQVMRAIADTGGLIGICCIPAFLGRSGDIQAFLDHIQHAVRTAGIDHVGIGTDTTVRLPDDNDAPPSPQAPPTPAIFESLWPPRDPITVAQWRQPRMIQSLAWTNWPLFTVGLVQRGLSDNDILKILGGNILRVMAATAPER
jgi:membrane dipeptidase